MSKVDANLRTKVITFLSEHQAPAWECMSTSDCADLLKEGMKGLNDYTDEELYEDLAYIVDVDIIDDIVYNLKREMEVQLAIESILEEES